MRNMTLALAAASGVLLRAVGADAAPSPKSLVEIADLTDVALSPDGAVAAFRREKASVETNRYDTVWFVVPTDGSSPPRRIADGGEPLRYNWGPPLIEPPVWSPDSRWIYYRAEFDGQVQVWRAARDGSAAEPLTHDAADVESFALSGDGKSLRYTVGASRDDIRRAEDDEYDRGIRIDDKVWVGAGLYRSGYINGRLATQRYTGNGFVTQGLLADQPKRQRIVDLATLAVRDATDAERAGLAGAGEGPRLEADAAAEAISPSPLGHWTAYLTARPDSHDLFTLKTLKAVSAGGAGIPITCPAASCQDVDFASLAWRPGHDEVVFTVTDHARGRAQSLYDWDLAKGRVRLIVQAEGLLNGGRVESGEAPCSIGEQLAVCVEAAANTPPRLTRVDLATGARQLLYDANPSLHDGSARPVSLMTWKDEAGRPFTGQFFAPAANPSGRPAPLFITYYGCPGYVRGGTPGDEWPLATLAADGIAALCINAPFGVPYEATERFDPALSAVRSVIDILARQQVIDRTRVGMGGLSFGTEVTVWVAMKSNLLAAASVSSTLVSQTYYWMMALKGEHQLGVVRKAWGLGSPTETPDRWKLLSPSYNIDKIHTPILMQLPEQEYLETLDYFAPLARSSTPVEMFVYPNESHQKVVPRHKLAVYERNLDWFRFWLQGYVDPDPRKAEQYARWRAERDRAAKAASGAAQVAPPQARGSGRAGGPALDPGLDIGGDEKPKEAAVARS